MLSIASGHSAEYLTGQVGQGRESYYTGAVDAGEPPGLWNGSGAATLGLAGEVDADVMHAVFNRFADPRDPSALDPAGGELGAKLGRPPKQFRSADDVVAARVEAYSSETGSAPLPEQVQAWRIEAERDTPSAVMFHDVTYSPVKSVTVLHTAFERSAYEAARAGNTEAAAMYSRLAGEIAEAVHVANGVMLDRMAHHGGYARTGRHGSKSTTGRWVDAHDFVVASFFQHTSRDHDPQLHIHNAILNRVECPDGQWRALDGKALYSAKQGAGAIADRVLEVELSRRLGVTWRMRADGVAREIEGVDAAAMDLFSSRSKTLTAKAQELIAAAEARHGRQLTSLERDRLRRQASMATRRAKTHEGESREEMLDRWAAELAGEVVGSLGRIGSRFAELAARAGADARAGAGAVAGTTVPTWSPELVISAAVEACHSGGPDGATTGRATFGRSELTRQILDALPDNLGPLTADEVSELAESLTDLALAGAGVVPVAGLAHGSEPADSRLADGRAATVAPGSQRWAAAGHVQAEIALLQAAGQRGRARLDEATVAAWLEGPGSSLSPAQREVVAGLATSDAALSVLIGPAGTGKSYTAGQLAALWADHAGGRVIGVAIAQVAADVLADDGVPDAANVTAFLTAHARIAEGRALPSDDRWRLGRGDVLLVDEASMLDTSSLTKLRDVVEGAGARMVLMGDPHQLGAVGAGGMMRTAIDHGASTFTLSEVRRFRAEWEGPASLRLREGDPSVVVDYDARGRLIDAGTRDTAVARAAQAAAADHIAGKATLIVAGSNAEAAQAATAVREQLVALGLVEAAGVVLGRDGTTAGVGDVVQARRLDRTLGLTNREVYKVTAVGEGGSLTVTSTRTGQTRAVPAAYVAEHLTLGYAGTAHAAQGLTLDTCHALITPGMDTAAAYVALTRGRQDNTGWTVTDSGYADTPRATPAAVLAGVLAGADDDTDASALDVTARDAQRRTNAATLAGLIEDETRIAARVRLDAHLDQLVTDGLLDERTRARFGADQGTEHLARLLRAHEHAGTDPAQLLRTAVAARSLDSALSVAQVVAARIDTAHPLPIPALTPTPDVVLDVEAGEPVLAGSDTGPDGEPLERDGLRPAGGLPLQVPAPAGTTPERARHLEQLHQALDDRRRVLGAAVADEGPAWAVDVLGPLPDDADRRREWEDAAGTIAAVREVTGWTSTEQALGRCPGVSTPEKRALWHRAYAAAGMPEHRRPEADMSDGRLLVRAAAAAREEAHAPHHVHDLQRAHHQAAADHARAAQLARARGDHAAADQLDTQAADAAEAARRLDDVAQTRAEWLAATLETREAGRAAREELTRRGIDPNAATGAVSAEEWLALDREAREADDAHRDITEADLAPEVIEDPSAETVEPAVQAWQPTADEPPHSQAGGTSATPVPAASAVVVASVEVSAASAQAARDRLADRISQETAAASAAADDEDYVRRRREQEAAAATLAERADDDSLGAA